jgi:molybdenum cofactor synthesis domain-containing protein
MRVAVITVGDELLAGDVVNTNAAWLGREVTERGASVARMVVVPDDPGAIAAEVAAASDEFDAVVVTGGLGPTHDDCTMAGMARAFDREYVEHPDARAHFAEREAYAFEDLAAGTTHLPAGARMLPNEVGVAPGAVVENVYALPGVPEEMEAMFERVAAEFGGTTRHVEFVYADEPESALLDRMAALRERFDVTVGSYPGDAVRVKLQAADPEEVAAAAEWLRERVDSPSSEPADGRDRR